MLPTASSSAPSSTITSPSTGKNSHVIRQKVMAVATAVAVVGTLAACGNDDADSEPSTITKTKTTDQTTTKTATTTTRTTTPTYDDETPTEEYTPRQTYTTQQAPVQTQNTGNYDDSYGDEDADEDVPNAGVNGPKLEWRTQGPFGSGMGCEQHRDHQPIQSTACYRGNDGNFYYQAVVQAPR
ncbi:hypothetical protein [Corynebacterium kroppenstedtii]|uniref:hypothetical protein n=1 Tax=Corynebacterium kroppenstedtii TaxID=161879 RepID=UPI0038732DBB